MASVDERVFAETLKLEEQMPKLLRDHAGQWVVFRDGAAHSFHPNFETAHRIALDAFGPHGAFVIAEVAPRGARSLSRAAGRLFGS